MLARYYSSSLSRFLGVDPSRSSIAIADPQTWNRYSYAANNPLRFTDPNGQSLKDEHQADTRTILGDRTFWAATADRIAARTREMDNCSEHTNAGISPGLHFGGFETLYREINNAIDARAAGDESAFIEHSARAFHLAKDAWGTHQDTGWLEHAVRGVLGKIFGSLEHLNPDSPKNRMAGKWRASGNRMMEWVRDRIESGQRLGEQGFKGEFDRTIPVKKKHVLYEVKKYAGMGYTVFVDGECKANCGH